MHFTLTMLAAPGGYIALARLQVLPDPAEQPLEHQHVGILLTTFFLGLGLEGLYEIYEWIADHALGANLQEGNTDTVLDLAASGAGALAGGALLVLWSAYGWTTTRRVARDRVPILAPEARGEAPGARRG